MKPLDKRATLPASRGSEKPYAERLGGGLCHRLLAISALAITINLNAITYSNAYNLSAKQIDWVLVAYNHLGGDLYESQCYVELIMRESSFNPRARNGSHYGLAQMRNVEVKDLSPRNQVRWHMKYIDHRYDGSPCAALKHLIKRGWH